jgi:tetratricopeptide (TPR) repeat protein
VLLTLSRGGIVFFGAGQVALLGLALWLHSRKDLPEGAQKSWLRPVLGALLIAVTASVGAYIAYEPVMSELHTADSLEKIQHSKVELWPMMMEAAVSVWPLGMGRGAFEQGMPRYQTLWPDQTFTHAENVVLQLLTEFGFGATLLFAALALYVLGRRLRLVESALEGSALVALFALCLHELFDFSLELSGCALATVLVTAALFPRHLRDQDGLGLKGRAGVVLPLTFVAAAVLGLCAWMARPLAQDAEAKLAALAAQLSPSELRKASLPFIALHPADYRLYSMVGAVEVNSPKGDPLDGLAFLNRALFLKRLDAYSHREAALALRRLHRPSQALLEYRLAVESGARADDIWARALPLVKSEDDLRSLFGDDVSLAPLFAQVLMGVRRYDDARRVLSWAEEDPQGKPLAPLWLTQARLEVTEQRYDAGLAALDEAERRGADLGSLYALRAEVYRREGRPEEATRTLEVAAERHPEDLSVGMGLVQSYLASGRPVRAREVLVRLRPYVHDRASYYQAEGATYQGEGKLNLALSSYQSASRLSPERWDLHFAIAQMYEALHRPMDAEVEVRAGAQAQGPSGKAAAEVWLARLESERRELEDRVHGARSFADGGE